MSIPKDHDLRARCRAAIRLALAGVVAFAALTACRKTAPEPRDAGASAAAEDAASAPDPCPPLPDDAITDEDHPKIRASGKPVDGQQWLEARGVSRASAVAWLGQRYGRHLDLPVAPGPCTAITVGKPAEEAIVCQIDAPPSLLIEEHGVIVVVRQKRIEVVLEAGLALLPLDFEDTHDFDQTLTIDADGMRADVRDRAPEGSTLVESRAACRARYERASHGIPPPPPFGIPATLRGCVAAKKALSTSVREMKGADQGAIKEMSYGVAFIDKSCRESGPYVWKGDRFVRQPW